jgi:hypothetical protein
MDGSDRGVLQNEGAHPVEHRKLRSSRHGPLTIHPPYLSPEFRIDDERGVARQRDDRTAQILECTSIEVEIRGVELEQREDTQLDVAVMDQLLLNRRLRSA